MNSAANELLGGVYVSFNVCVQLLVCKSFKSFGFFFLLNFFFDGSFGFQSVEGIHVHLSLILDNLIFIKITILLIFFRIDLFLFLHSLFLMIYSFFSPEIY